MSIQLIDGFQGQSLDRVLEDVLVRFVLFAQPPADEPERIFFDMELALWFYVDLVRIEHPQLQNFKKIKQFCKKLAELWPFLWDGDIEQGLKKWSGYKSMVPVRGVALFDKTLTKLLLVQGTESKSWSFPRGKIEQDETDADAAIREAKEEVGLDLSPYLNEKEFIERTVNGKNYKIFLCKNIPDDVAYRPTVRNEINAINWKNFRALTKELKKSQGNYFLLNTMMGSLNQWARKQRGEINEVELMSEVEEQLKKILGIGEQPLNDPGRELLDILRQSTANKQLLQQQQHPGHTLPPMPLPPFPMYPPGMAFHPPSFQQFQQMQFNAPFAPPILPPGAIHPQQLPPFAFNPMIGGMPFMQRPQIIQQPPTIAQLQRPSLSMRNDVGSTELLGLLNKKDDKRPSTKPTVTPRADDGLNSKKHTHGLLALLGKSGSKEEPSNASKASSLLKKEPQSETDSPVSSRSADLMSLLKQKKTPGTNQATVSSPSAKSPLSRERTQSPQPKFKILKREENGKTLNNTPPKKDMPQKKASARDSKSQYKGITEQTPPPSQELLSLIKQSRNEDDDEAEMFEDFTDEEYDDMVMSVDEQESNVPETISSHATPVAPKKLTILKREEPTAVPTSPPFNNQSPVSPPKKFTILKRGESLEEKKPPTSDLVKEEHNSPPPNEEQEVEADGHSDGDTHSVVSTIKFSDDSDDSDDNDDNVNDHEADNDEYHDSLELPSQEATPQPVENIPAKVDLLELLHGSATPKQEEDIQSSESDIINNLNQMSPQLSTNSARADLLGLLHGKIDSMTPPSEPASSTKKPDILAELNKSPSPQVHEVITSVSSEIIAEQTSTKPGADLLELLHGKQSSPTTPPVHGDASHDILSILHRKPTSSQEPESQPLSHESGTPATGLMSLLHKIPTPPHAAIPTNATSVSLDQTNTDEVHPAKHSKNLLNLLFKR